MKIQTPRGIARGINVSCMVSADLMAGTVVPINGSSRISRMELDGVSADR